MFISEKILGELIQSCVQVASVSCGSFASAMQLNRYVYSGYKSFVELNGDGDPNLSSLSELSKSVTLLVTSLFFSQIAGLIHDALEIHSGIVDLTNGNYREGIFKIGFSSLSLTAQLTLNIHARVALISITILLDLGRAISCFRNERYIEGVGSIMCAVIRARKNSSLFAQYKQLWASFSEEKKSDLVKINVRSIKKEDFKIDQKNIERRVAIDVGSGATKVIIADVDITTNKIINVIHQTSIPVAYQKDLEASQSGGFSKDIQEIGVNTFNEIKELANQYQADKIYAVATAAFRTSNNGDDFARHVTESTGIPVKIISQFEEGVLAYESASEDPSLQSKNYICWDIGTGSFQITSPKGEKDYDVYMVPTGSVPFKNHIIEIVKGEDPKEVDSPNPLSSDAIKQADSYARWIGRHAQKSIKEMIKEQDGSIVGIGRLFQNSLLPLSDGDKITRKDLRNYIRNAENRTDEELNSPFAHVDISNAILALGVMKALHIHEISVVETTSTKGMLAHETYWADAAV